MITIDELKAKLGGMKTAVDDLRDALSIEASEKRLAELEHQMTMPGFYDDQARSQKVISEMGEVKNKLERFGKLSTQYEEAETLLLMIEEENDPSLATEGEEAVNGVEKSIDELQLMTMLNGEYDHNNAILTFHAGTGGDEVRPVGTVYLGAARDSVAYVKKLFVSRPDRALVRARAAQAALELALRLAQGKVPAGTQALTAAQQSDDEALAALDEAFVR